MSEWVRNHGDLTLRDKPWALFVFTRRAGRVAAASVWVDMRTVQLVATDCEAARERALPVPPLGVPG